MTVSDGGYVTEDGENRLSNRVWTRAGMRSLEINETVASSAAEGDPAAIAIPLQVQDLGSLLLEVVDDRQDRTWTEDDRFLVMEVATQLALALDNAQLYNSVQQELAERIRAEKAILRRNKDLATLNRIGQQLGRLATRTEIYELLSNMIGEVLDNRNLSICDCASNPKMIAYPIHRRNGAPVEMPDHPFGSGVAEYVIRSRAPLLITSRMADQLREKGIVPRDGVPASLIAIPLITGERTLGAIVVQDFDHEQAFDELHVELLSTAAAQVSTALENAQAYELTQQAIEEMKELDRVKSQFLANMSHELRTPLNSIIGFSRVIIKGIDGPVNDTQQQDLTAIYNSGQHLLSLINDILDLSKIEAGKMQLSYSEIKVADLVNSTMSTAMGLVKDKPIQLHTDIPDPLTPAWGDNTRVRQVLINFLSNAAKFTDEGTITVKAAQVTSPEGKPEIMVTVTDSGPGIAAADQGKLFLPFSQVDDSPTRKTGGTGLGLSICRSLIEMHGGRIGLLSSEVDKGSTFFFTLPAAVPENHPRGSIQGKNVILAIDDDQRVISLYERYLQPHGYTVISLTDPAQALKRAAETKPLAITLDMMMPGKDGWRVLEELKKAPETRAIPVIICSILESQEKAFTMGADDYLVKPFLEEDILKALAKIHPK